MNRFMIIIVLLLAQSCDNSANKALEYMASGKTSYEKGNYDKAKLEFKNVLELDSKQADAYYHLALIDEKDQNWQDMLANLTKATELDPTNIEAFLKLSRLALLSGNLDEALSPIGAVLKIAANNPDALTLKGAILVKQGKLDDAMSLAERVLRLFPDHTDAVSLKTAIYIAKNELASALTTVEKALQIKPNDASLLLLRMQVDTHSNNKAAVEQDYLELIKQDPDKLDYSYALVKHYSDTNQVDKALSMLQALVDRHPDKMQPKLALVEYQIQKNPDLAEKSLVTYLGQYPEEPDLYFRLAALCLKQDKLNEAKEALERVIELEPDGNKGLNAKVALAKIAFQENDPDTAMNTVKEVLSVDEKHLDAALLKAKLDLQSGAYDEVISDLRTVLKDNPNSADAMTLMGQAYLKTDSPELAEESFKKVLAINPANFDALLPVIANLIKNKEAAKADELLLKALNVIPDHPGALQALAQVRLMQKDWVGAQKVADFIASKPQGAGFSKFLSARISEEQGHYKEATGLYKEALKLAPDLSDALRGMANSYEALKQNQAMYDYLDGFIAAHPSDPNPWLLKSQMLAKDNRSDESIMVLSEAIGKWPKIPEFYEALATNHLKNKDSEQAIAAIKKGLDTIPSHIRLNIMLASIYDQLGEYAKSLEIYELLAAEYPNVDLIVNNLVSLLLDHFNTKENNARALDLAKRIEHAQQPVFIDTYAWALINNGKSEEALSLLRVIVKKMPEVPVFRYHLATAYHKTNSKALAVTELEEALKLGKKTGGFIEQGSAEKLLQTLKGSP